MSLASSIRPSPTRSKRGNAVVGCTPPGQDRAASSASGMARLAKIDFKRSTTLPRAMSETGLAGVQVRELRAKDVTACAGILTALPEWFGLAESNREYVDSLCRIPAAVAERETAVIGFVGIEPHNPRSVEILVMAVDPHHHRAGVGSALLAWAEAWCRNADVPWLHVKTRGPSTPDPGYERTRRFYIAAGFDPLFESKTLWGPEDAALILVKRLP